MARRGRGRLSTIDKLPEDAHEDIHWAYNELRQMERDQKDILEEFNLRLLSKGLGPISKSAFNRHAIRLATVARRLEETKSITTALMARQEPGESDDLTVMVAETIKTLVFEMLEGAKDFTPKHAMEMASALHKAAAAQKVSSDRRKSVEADLENKVEEVTDRIGKEMGLGADVVAQIRKDILGVREKPSNE